MPSLPSYLDFYLDRGNRRYCASYNAFSVGPYDGLQTLRINDNKLYKTLAEIFRDHWCSLNSDRMKELLRAAEHTDQDSTIKLILKRNPELIELFPKGTKLSILWIAVLGYHYKSAELLVRLGADVNERIEVQGEIKSFLPKGTSILQVLLQMYPTSSNRRLIHLVVEHLADLQVRDSLGRNVLHCALIYDRGVQLTKLFLERGVADVNAVDDKGRTALHYATDIGRGAEKVLSLLLKHGADVHARDNKGMTALLCAATSSEAEKLLPLLTKHGADIFAKDSKGHNVLFYLAYSGRKHSAAELAKVLIIEKGVSFSDKEYQQLYQPIHVAAWRGNDELVELFLDYGANVNVRAKNGRFPLYGAAQFDRPGTLLTLLKRGANIDLKTFEDRSTALHVACGIRKSCAGSCVKILLSVGADMFVKDRYGKTPFARIARIYQEYRKNANNWLMLKALALKKVKQPFIELADERIIERFPKLRDYYLNCIKFVYGMKFTRFIQTCTFHELLTQSHHRIAPLMRNPDFEINFRRYDLSQFSMYATDILEAFESARNHYCLILELEEVVDEAFYNVLPHMVVRRLARYMLNCEVCELKKIVHASRGSCIDTLN